MFCYLQNSIPVPLVLLFTRTVPVASVGGRKSENIILSNVKHSRIDCIDAWKVKYRLDIGSQYSSVQLLFSLLIYQSIKNKKKKGGKEKTHRIKIK